MSWTMYCGWPSPPIEPSVIQGWPPRRRSIGVRVWSGRAPGERAFGLAGSRLK
jgi:hypothetical protein